MKLSFICYISFIYVYVHGTLGFDRQQNQSANVSQDSSTKLCYGPDYESNIDIYPIPIEALSYNLCIHSFFNPGDPDYTSHITDSGGSIPSSSSSSSSSSMQANSSVAISFTFNNKVYGKETLYSHNPSSHESLICIPGFHGNGTAGADLNQTTNTNTIDNDDKNDNSWIFYELCLGFNNVFVSEEWANLCPKFVIQDYGASEQQHQYIHNLPCFSVGNDDFDAVEKLVAGNNDFTFNLLSSNALTADIVTDMFVSPFSLVNSLVTALMGARGRTRSQIMHVFGLTKYEFSVFDSFDAILQSLQHWNETITSSSLSPSRLRSLVENRLWIDQYMYPKIATEFLHDFDRFGNIIRTNLSSLIADDDDDDKKTRQMINDYVSEKTDHLITDVFPTTSSAQKKKHLDALMFFTDIVSFSADWHIPFPGDVVLQFTAAQDRHKIVNVPMMRTEKNIIVQQYIDSEVEIIELPFASQEFSDFSFLMIRPTTTTTTTATAHTTSSTIEFEKRLNRNLLKHWMGKLRPTLLSDGLALPFLEMYNVQDVTLALKTQGIRDLFDPQRCDLSGMTTTSSSSSSSSSSFGVYETLVNRQDRLSITQKGIRVASVSTDSDFYDSQDINQGPIKHADRPFLFLVMERSKDMILFAGRVTNPEGWMMYDPSSDKSDKKNGAHNSVAATFFIILFVALMCLASVGCLARMLYNMIVLSRTGADVIPGYGCVRACLYSAESHVQNCRNRRRGYYIGPNVISGQNRNQLYGELPDGSRVALDL